MARRRDNEPTVTDGDVDARRRYEARADQRSMADIVDDENRDAEVRGYRKGKRDALSSVSRSSSRIRPPAGVGQLGDSRDPASTTGGVRTPRPVRVSGAPVFAPMIAELGIITTRAIVKDKRAPLPYELGAAVFVFGALSLPQGDWGDVALMVAWGLVLATLYGTIASNPTLPGRVGKAIAGEPPGKPPAAPSTGGTRPRHE